jgi:hypothetical protein
LTRGIRADERAVRRGGTDIDPDVIALRRDRKTVALDRSVFTALFDTSAVHSRAPCLHGLESSSIGFADFQELARNAHIRYSLFFAPPEVGLESLSPAPGDTAA